MNKALWVVQVVLALLFFGAGGMKVMTPASELAAQMPWIEDFPVGSHKIIGALEVAGAIGIVVPAATGILPMLTPAAAGGLALTMVGAGVTHLSRAEYSSVMGPLALLGLSLFVAYGRLRTHPSSGPSGGRQ